jgi:hypothetical protein
MFKLALVAIITTGLVSIGPAVAEPNSGTSSIGRGCTLDPFTRTMRCIDFDNCTTDKNGKKTCPVVVTPYGKLSAASSTSQPDQPQPYLQYRMTDAMISSY